MFPNGSQIEKPCTFSTHVDFRNCHEQAQTIFLYLKKKGFDELIFIFVDDNIDETYGVNVQFESDEEVSFLFIIFFFIFISVYMQKYN